MTNNEASTADNVSYPEPHPWPYPTNPTEVRRAEDGRIALYFTWRGKDFAPTDGWLVLSTPNGQLQLEHLTNEDVADWATVVTP